MPLDEDRILDADIGFTEDHGLAGLSMRRLGRLLDRLALMRAEG